jgi:hypothetical protein
MNVSNRNRIPLLDIVSVGNEIEEIEEKYEQKSMQD